MKESEISELLCLSYRLSETAATTGFGQEDRPLGVQWHRLDERGGGQCRGAEIDRGDDWTDGEL